MTLKLALWQGAGAPGDLAATVAQTARVAALTARESAGILVFPEGFLTGYHIPGLAPGGLPGIEGALLEVAGIAAASGLCLVMGTHLEAAGQLRNAAVVFSGAGDELGRYHKRALFGGWEKATFVPGDQALRFDCSGFRVGVAICYDVEFPELIRAEALAGVDLVVVPTALMAPHDRVARQIVPVRAMENQIFLGYANRSGLEPGFDFVGLSRICGPEGAIMAEAGAGPALVMATLERAQIAAARAKASYLDDLSRLRGEPA